jgi:chaperone required for assembly of F1-ATPase
MWSAEANPTVLSQSQDLWEQKNATPHSNQSNNPTNVALFHKTVDYDGSIIFDLILFQIDIFLL